MTTTEPAPAPVAIRRARREDLLAIYQLEQVCFPSPWPYQAFIDQLGAPAFLLATIDDALAGYVVADVSPSRDGHIKDLAVEPTYRRCGVASRLLVACMSKLGLAGAIGVSLEVREDNAPARALYQTFGFHEKRIAPGYYTDGTDAVIMYRALP